MLSVDEDARRRFEADWLSGNQTVAIREYLPISSTDTYLGTLEELVCIDLEFRWRNSVNSSQSANETITNNNSVVPTRVEDYVREFPELKKDDVLQRLIGQEILARVNSGFVVEASEYRSRFPSVPIDESLFEGHTQVEVDSQPLPAQQRLDSFPKQFGNYVLTAELGRGGMGSVYRARQPSAGREVAIKIADVSSLNAMSRNLVATRFETEAHAASSLNHDNIVPIYDVGTVDDQPYYAMRLVEGGDLAAMSKEEPLEPKRAAKYILGIARGIAAAHGRGMLHRDVKPQNMLVDGETDRAMLTDFGLARFMLDDSGLTQSGQVLGTPSYMPPEQIKDSSKIDARADVYSLGGSLYQLITGKPPFKAADMHETLRQVINDDPVPAVRVNTAIPLELDTICLKCLEKEPDARYLSAKELADELERFVDGRPILAQPVSGLRKVAKWCGRNKQLAATIAFAIAATLAALIATSAGLLVTNDLNNELEVKNEELADSNIELKRKQESIRNLSDFSDEVLDQVMERVSNDPVMTTPDLAPFRRTFLDLAVAYYERLISIEDAIVSPANKAVAMTNLAIFSIELEYPLDESSTTLREALKLINSLPPEESKTVEVLKAKSDALNGLALVYRKQNQLKESLDCFQQATDIRKQWVEAAPADNEAKRKLANALMNQGLILAADGKLSESEGRQMDGQLLRRKLLDDGETDSKLRRDYAKGAFNLAMLQFRNGDVAEVVGTLNKSTVAFRELASESTGDANLWRLLAQSLVYEAEFRIAIGRATEFENAVPLIDEALTDLDSLVHLSLGKPAAAIPLLELYQQGLETLLNIQSQPHLDPSLLTPNASDLWANHQRLMGKVASKIEGNPDSADDGATKLKMSLLELGAMRQKALLLAAESQRLRTEDNDSSAAEESRVSAKKTVVDAIGICEQKLSEEPENPQLLRQLSLLSALKQAFASISE